MPDSHFYKVDFLKTNVPLDQDKEKFLLEPWPTAVPLHNYDFIYEYPGLYDYILYDRLQCKSDAVVTTLLFHTLDREGKDASRMRVLDAGAGPGNVGERLAKGGFGHVINADINPLAKKECERRRPKTYNDYIICDLADPNALSKYMPIHCITIVAALSHNHMPLPAVKNCIHALQPGGFIATTLSEKVAQERSELSAFFWDLVRGSGYYLHKFERYVHRLSTQGEPIFYYAVVAEKLL